MDQQKELVTKKDHRTGEETAYYRKGQPRETFYIPFTKKKVEEILGDHPFGPDSPLTLRIRIVFFTMASLDTLNHPLDRLPSIMKSLRHWTFQQMLDKVKPRANIPLETELANAIRKLPQYT